MKIVFFKVKWYNLKQMTIALFSWSGICHTALLFNGERKLYDASESRGNVDYNKDLAEFGNQEIIVYSIPEDEAHAKAYALSKRFVTPYDWKGIMGWFPFLASNDARTVYCFELVLQTLATLPTINGKSVKEIGQDILPKLFRKTIDSDDIFVLLERAELTPIYEGKAKDFFAKA